MIIGITGTIGAGKGTVVDFLVAQGFKHYSVRQFLIEEIEKRGIEKNRDNMVLVANEFREKFGSGYILDKLIQRANSHVADVVIESIRSLGEVESLKKSGGILISVDEDINRRYKRIIERSSSTDKITFEEFLFQNDRENTSNDQNKGNLFGCIELADHSIINDGGIEDLKNKVTEVLGKIRN